MSPPLVDRVEYLGRLCQGKRVLHLGCTNAPYTDTSLREGSLLHLQLLSKAAELHGVDADTAGLERLRALGIPNLHVGDLERLERAQIPGDFDVIVAGEIIEHLSNPGLFLDGIKRFMSPGTTLVITTVNAYCGFRMAQYALRGSGGRREPVHPDHVAYYSYATLHRLLNRAGLVITTFSFYDLGREHRPFTRFYVDWINDFLMLWARQLADGVIAECRLEERPTTEAPAP